MQSISRRGFVISAAAAGAAFGLDGPLEFLTPAFAQKAEPRSVRQIQGRRHRGHPDVRRHLGEGARSGKFIKNASLDEVKAALKAGGLTDAHVPIPFTVTAIRTKGKLVLFDSGTGAQLAPTAGIITKNEVWKAAGIDPAKVDTIVITHFHADHISGLMAKDTNAPIFPNADDLRAGGRVQVLDRLRRPPRAPPSASRPCSRPGRTSSSSRATRRSCRASSRSTPTAIRRATPATRSAPAAGS